MNRLVHLVVWSVEMESIYITILFFFLGREEGRFGLSGGEKRWVDESERGRMWENDRVIRAGEGAD
jgi:hypothetical protein